MKTTNTKCSYPWFNLNSNTDGSVKLCCAIYDNFHLLKDSRPLNFSTDDIETIWNSSQLSDVRSEMSAGARPATCKVCWNQEDKGLDSARMAINAEGWLSDEAEPTKLPQSLELRMGNKCNLKCMTCWPLSSSSIAEERETALAENLPSWLSAEWKKEIAMLPPRGKPWYESAIFRESISKVAPGLRRLYLTGGEPTLIRENSELLGTLIEKGNTDCFVSLTSNLTVWNEEFYEMLKKFRRIEIQISIDGYGELNDYIRHPSKFSVIDRNLSRLLDEFPQATIKVYSVVSVLNFLFLDRLAKYLITKFESRPAVWSPIILQAPEQLSLEVASQASLTEAKRRISGVARDPGKLHTFYAISTIQTYLDHLINQNSSPRPAAKTSEFIGTMNRLRNNRHPFQDEMTRLGAFGE